MPRNRIPVLVIGAAALIFTAASNLSRAASDKAVGAGNDWPAVGGAADESSYSRLDHT